MASEQNVGYKILGRDDLIYGPVELPELIQWVREQRVEGGTWVYDINRDAWRKAAELDELRMFFEEQEASSASTRIAEEAPSVPGVSPGALRRIKVFASLTDDELKRLIGYMESKQVKQFGVIVRQGEPGDSMFFLLDGEARVRIVIGGKESILAQLSTGDFFGEIALFDHGPRSADVVANEDSHLLRLSARSFEKMLREAPDIAAPFLFGVGRTLMARIRADNKRFTQSVAFARMGSVV